MNNKNENIVAEANGMVCGDEIESTTFSEYREHLTLTGDDRIYFELRNCQLFAKRSAVFRSLSNNRKLNTNYKGNQISNGWNNP